MNWRIISTLVAKDLVLYFKNPFFAFVTVLGLVFYVAIYMLMPAEVDETIALGIIGPSFDSVVLDQAADEGLELVSVDTLEQLQQGVIDGDYVAGVVIPDDFAAALASGGQPEIQAYLASDLPPEFRDIYVILLEEIFGGQTLNLNVTEEILGVDRAGEQIPYRDRLLPLLAFAVLMVETLGLASLISSEVEGGTIRALLTTPVRVEGLFTAKAIMGTGLAFIQVVVLVLITDGLRNQPLLMLLAIFLGSLLTTGVGFLIASVGRDLMSVMGWGILALLLLIIPSFTVLIPGLTTGWIRIIPSYFLVDTMYGVAALGAGWQDVGGNLAALLASSLLFLGLGVLAMRRRYQ